MPAVSAVRAVLDRHASEPAIAIILVGPLCLRIWLQADRARHMLNLLRRNPLQRLEKGHGLEGRAEDTDRRTTLHLISVCLS